MVWHNYLCALIVLSVVQVTYATEQSFPYQAVVVNEQVEVRCGPGSKFYVTGYVDQQQQVTVHRHDHGGWFMIAPPQGSISWIETQHVERTGNTTGVVKAGSRAIVRIGSEVSDEHSFYGRELSNGDVVKILGEERLSTPTGPVSMYKIRPPAQEFRWIKGQFVVPINHQIQQVQAIDPYQVPPENRGHVVQTANVQTTVASATPVQSNMPKQQKTSRRSLQFQHLDQIDQAYAAMMKSDPKQWDLNSIQSQYDNLKATSDSTVQAVIDQRVKIINRRREILGHYKNFVTLANRTSKRDAELVAQQSSFNVSSSNQLQADIGQPPSMVSSAPVAPRMNGAGIIRQGNRVGGPAFVLTAPDGRFLAYLELAKPISIQNWIGKEAGVIGKRSFDPNLRADLIRVQKIVPVQLIP